MINGKSVLAIIPARGGSKGLPDKNILPLADKPLIVWSIEAARESKYIDKCMVSTDDDKISDIVTNLASKNDYINDIYNNRISDLFSVRVKENFFKSMSLADYVKKNNCNLKPLLFQLIHTLAVIQNEYNGFRHNNLDINNIYVYLKKSKDNQTIYSFNGNNFYLHNNEFDIKISNFSNATILNSNLSFKNIPFAKG